MIKKILFAVSMFAALAMGMQPAYAQSPSPTPTTVIISPSPSTSGSPSASASPQATPTGPAQCGTTKTQIVSCSGKTGVEAIGGLIKTAITVLTILIAVVATGGIVYGALLYSTARDSQSQLDQSKTIIRNVIIGLILYGFTVVIINWLIPGGVIG